MGLPYPGWNVVYGEIPAASKWSQLGANDDALAAGTGLNDLAIPTTKLADAAVTTRKLKPSSIDFTDPGAANFGVTATTYQNITGMTTTYTSGPTAERLFLWLTGMVNGSNGNYGFFGTLSVNGVALNGQYLTAPSGLWDIFFGQFTADIPANTTVTIQAMARTQSGGTVTWGRDANDVAYRGKIKGFAISNA